jgi:RNA-directed DNA polymerase
MADSGLPAFTQTRPEKSNRRQAKRFAARDIRGRVCMKAKFRPSRAEMAGISLLRLVDLKRAESFSFLGFDFWRVRSRAGRWMPLFRPRMKQRTALLGQLKVVFRSLKSQPVRQVISKINPILRGWINYFAIGHASQCFSFIRNWVEQKIRRHLAKAQLRRGFGWKRWNRRWLYDALGLFDQYRVRRGPIVSPTR